MLNYLLLIVSLLQVIGYFIVLNVQVEVPRADATPVATPIAIAMTEINIQFLLFPYTTVLREQANSLCGLSNPI